MAEVGLINSENEFIRFDDMTPKQLVECYIKGPENISEAIDQYLLEQAAKREAVVKGIREYRLKHGLTASLHCD